MSMQKTDNPNCNKEIVLDKTMSSYQYRKLAL